MRIKIFPSFHMLRRIHISNLIISSCNSIISRKIIAFTRCRYQSSKYLPKFKRSELLTPVADIEQSELSSFFFCSQRAVKFHKKSPVYPKIFVGASSLILEESWSNKIDQDQTIWAQSSPPIDQDQTKKNSPLIHQTDVAIKLIRFQWGMQAFWCGGK